jgi:hypothetical protein
MLADITEQSELVVKRIGHVGRLQSAAARATCKQQLKPGPPRAAAVGWRSTLPSRMTGGKGRNTAQLTSDGTVRATAEERSKGRSLLEGERPGTLVHIKKCHNIFQEADFRQAARFVAYCHCISPGVKRYLGLGSSPCSMFILARRRFMKKQEFPGISEKAATRTVDRMISVKFHN